MLLIHDNDRQDLYRALRKSGIEEGIMEDTSTGMISVVTQNISDEHDLMDALNDFNVYYQIK